MPDQALRRRASPYFRRLPCLKKCWSHGGLNVYINPEGCQPLMLLCLSSRLKVGRCGDFPQPALVALGETGVVGVAELET